MKAECPKCGASLSQTINRVAWKCGSYPLDRGNFYQAPDCRIRQLERVSAVLLAACNAALWHLKSLDKRNTNAYHETRKTIESAITQAEAAGIGGTND